MERKGKGKGRSAGLSDEQLKPISIKMLQGAFYALLAGYLLAGTFQTSPLRNNNNKHSKCLDTFFCSDLATISYIPRISNNFVTYSHNIVTN